MKFYQARLYFFFVGVVASFIGTVGLGVGLISFSLLVLLGIPPPVAIATNKLGMVGHDIGPLRTYQVHKKIRWHYVLPFSVIMTIGSAIGAWWMTSVTVSSLTWVVALMLLGVAGAIFFNKNVGVVSYQPTTRSKAVGYVSIFLISVWGGFITIGAAIFSTFSNIRFFGMSIIESKATDKIPVIIASIVALIIFARAGVISYTIGIPLFCGMTVGGYVGGRVVLLKGDRWTKHIVVALIIITAIKLFIDSF